MTEGRARANVANRGTDDRKTGKFGKDRCTGRRARLSAADGGDVPFQRGTSLQRLAAAGFPRHPRLSVGRIFLRPVGFHPDPCLLGAAERSAAALWLYGVPAGPADPALSPAPIHAALAAGDGGGIAGAGRA